MKCIHCSLTPQLPKVNTHRVTALTVPSVLPYQIAGRPIRYRFTNMVQCNMDWEVGISMENFHGDENGDEIMGT